MNIPIIILIVEDEPLIRMEIADDLSEKGFQVLEAPNAHEAMLLLESHSDIALLHRYRHAGKNERPHACGRNTYSMAGRENHRDIRPAQREVR